MQLTGAKCQQNFNFKLSECNKEACPCCLHCNTTIAVQNQCDVAASNKVARNALLKSGKTIIADKAYHGCYCYQFNCYGKPNGVGCHACVEKANKGVPFAGGTLPGMCPWNCELCNCNCAVAFQYHHQITIINSRQKALMKEQENGKEILAPTAAVSTVSQKAELGRSSIVQCVGDLIDYHTFNELEEVQLDGAFDCKVVEQNALSKTANDITAMQGSIQYASLGLQKMFPAPAEIRKMMPTKPPNSISQAKRMISTQLSSAGSTKSTSTVTNNVPPCSNFLSNKSTSSCAYQNGLYQKPKQVLPNHLILPSFWWWPAPRNKLSRNGEESL